MYYCLFIASLFLSAIPPFCSS